MDGYQCFPVLSALNQPQPLAVDDDDYSYDDDDDDYIYDDYAHSGRASGWVPVSPVLPAPQQPQPLALRPGQLLVDGRQIRCQVIITVCNYCASVP